MTGLSRPASASETFAWLLAVLVLTGLYGAGSAGLTPQAFGLNALRQAPPGSLPMIATAVLIVAAVAVALAARGATHWVASYPVAIAAGAVAGGVMFAWRSEFLNPDALMFAPKFQGAVPLSGAFITHDEMLEFLVHSRVWDYTHRWWGWSVEYSYQVTSSLAGSVVVVLAFRLAARLAPSAPGIFLIGLFSGAYMQLFFGDVENYTLTAVVVTGYLLAAARFLRRDAPLSEPAVVLALAMSFHLLAGWLLPSITYLAYISWSRTRDYAPLVRSSALAAGVIALTVVIVHFYGAPIWSIGASHAGRALRWQGMFVTEWSAAYYVEQANLLMLLAPWVLLLPMLAWWRRLAIDETGTFLTSAAGSLLVFQFVWKAQIGVYNDWNLFAIGGLVMGVLIWRSVAGVAAGWFRQAIAVALAAMAALHSYAWIAANHVHGQ